MDGRSRFRRCGRGLQPLRHERQQAADASSVGSRMMSRWRGCRGGQAEEGPLWGRSMAHGLQPRRDGRREGLGLGGNGPCGENRRWASDGNAGFPPGWMPSRGPAPGWLPDDLRFAERKPTERPASTNDPPTPELAVAPEFAVLRPYLRFLGCPGSYPTRYGQSVEVKLPWPDGRSTIGDWSEDGRRLTIPSFRQSSTWSRLL